MGAICRDRARPRRATRRGRCAARRRRGHLPRRSPRSMTDRGRSQASPAARIPTRHSVAARPVSIRAPSAFQRRIDKVQHWVRAPARQRAAARPRRSPRRGGRHRRESARHTPRRARSRRNRDAPAADRANARGYSCRAGTAHGGAATVRLARDRNGGRARGSAIRRSARSRHAAASPAQTRCHAIPSERRSTYAL